jgi:hypothetical protein
MKSNIIIIISLTKQESSLIILTIKQTERITHKHTQDEKGI